MPEVPEIQSVVVVKQDGSREIWQLTDTWGLLRTDPSPDTMASKTELSSAVANHAALPNVHHPQEHSHPTLGDVDFTGEIKVGGESGLTGTKTIAGYTFRFKKGLLVEFQAP